MSSYRDALRAKSRGAVKEVQVKDFGVVLKIRQMSAAQADEFIRLTKTDNGHREDSASFLISECLVDDNGKRIWDTPEEVRQEVYFKVREAYATEILKANDMNVEEAEKNSTPDRSSPSGTDSPSGSGAPPAS